MTNKPGGAAANASADTTANRANDEPDTSKGTSAPTTNQGADTVVESKDTERARVDGVDITRPNQRLVNPKDHGKLAPPHMAIANIPPGSEPTVIDPNTGRPAAPDAQVADEDEKRLDKIDQS